MLKQVSITQYEKLIDEKKLLDLKSDLDNYNFKDYLSIYFDSDIASQFNELECHIKAKNWSEFDNIRRKLDRKIKKIRDNNEQNLYYYQLMTLDAIYLQLKDEDEEEIAEIKREAKGYFETLDLDHIRMRYIKNQKNILDDISMKEVPKTTALSQYDALKKQIESFVHFIDYGDCTGVNFIKILEGYAKLADNIKAECKRSQLDKESESILFQLLAEISEDKIPNYIDQLTSKALQLKIPNKESSIYEIRPIIQLFFGINPLDTSDPVNKDLINRITRKISRFVHPDRTKIFSIEKQNRLSAVYCAIHQCKDTLENYLRLNCNIDHSEKNGDKSWSLYKYFKRSSSTANSDVAFQYLYSSYIHYQDACEIADRDQIRNKQISLRKKVAFCLYTMDLLIEAQLYVIMAIKFTRKYLPMDDAKNVLPELVQLLDKIHDKPSHPTNLHSSVDEKKENKTGNASNQASPMMPRKVPLNERNSQVVLFNPSHIHNLKNLDAISQDDYDKGVESVTNEVDLEKLDLMIVPERSTISHGVSSQNIQEMQARSRSLQNKVFLARGATVASFAGTISVATVPIATAALTVLDASSKAAALAQTITSSTYSLFGLWSVNLSGVAASEATLFAALGGWGGILGVGAMVGSGLSIVIGGAWVTAYLIEKGNDIANEPQLREEMNKKVQEAMGFYVKKQYREFLETLGAHFEIGDDTFRFLSFESKTETIISLEKCGRNFSENIIDFMLSHGFPPDGLGSLINAIGHAISSRRLNIDRSAAVLDQKSREIFNFLIQHSKALLAKSKEIDDQENRRKKTGVIRNAWNFIHTYIRDTIWGAPEETDDNSHSTCESRLTTMLNTARLNLATSLIIEDIDQKYNQDTARMLIDQVLQSFGSNDEVNDHIQFKLDMLRAFVRMYDYNLCEKIIPKRMLEYKSPELSYLNKVTRIYNLQNEDVLTQCELTPIDTNVDNFFRMASSWARDNGLPVHFEMDTFFNDLRSNQNTSEFKDAITSFLTNKKEASLESLITTSEKHLYADIDELTLDSWITTFQKHPYVDIDVLTLFSTMYNINIKLFKPSISESLIYFDTKLPAGEYSPTLEILMVEINKDTVEGYAKSPQIYFTPFKRMDPELAKLTEQIASCTNPKAKCHSLIQRANLKNKSGIELLSQRKKLEAMKAFEQALEDINDAISLSKDTEESNPTLYYFMADLYLKLERPKMVLARIAEKKDGAKEWLAKAYYKMNDYSKCITLIQKLSNKNENITLLLEKARRNYKKQQKAMNMRLKDYERPSDMRYFEQTDLYRPLDKTAILSVDGGGIRGLIPSLFLSKIEQKIKRPLWKVFPVMTGTSTGGIIVGGLSSKVPGSEMPVSAYDLVKLYSTEAETVFKKVNLLGMSHLFKQKYDSCGIKSLLKSRLADATLSQTRSDLYIPAIDESQNYSTHMFMTTEAKKDPLADYSMVDVLCATSAAPTFFKPHKIGNRRFLDGGVRLNNPANKTLELVLSDKKLELKDTFLLSFGTGEYISNPIDTSKGRGLLFWAGNFPDVAMGGESFDTDSILNTKFFDYPGRYYRFQSYLNEPLSLDQADVPSIQKLLDISDALAEDEIVSDQMDRVVETLLCMKGE